LGQPPTFTDKVPNLIALHGTTAGLGEYLARHAWEGCVGESGLDKLVPADRYFSVQKVLCLPVGIRYQDEDGAPIFVDQIHFGSRGSAFMARRLAEFMNASLGTHFIARPLPAIAFARAAPATRPAPAVAAAVTANPLPPPMDQAGTRAVLADLQSLQAALAAYRHDHGEYPRSVGFDGLHTAWGRASPDWIRGLVPRYLPRLPRDPRYSSDPHFQYLYRSDGTDYKLIAHGNCEPFNVSHPRMIDPNRSCFAVGFWTAGAQGW
jgi:type II secretory pathway pseudopilin PulG